MEIKKRVILRSVAGETLLIPVEDAVKDYNGIFTLSPSGAVIFQTLADGGDEADAAEAVFNEFEVSREEAAEDVRAFVAALRDFGIV